MKELIEALGKYDKICGSYIEMINAYKAEIDKKDSQFKSYIEEVKKLTDLYQEKIKMLEARIKELESRPYNRLEDYELN